DPANPLRRDTHLSALHAFEYGAQATAVHGGLLARLVGAIAPPGYLAALRDARLHVAFLDDIRSPLEIFANRLFGDGSNTVYECRVSAGDTLLANGRITIVQRTYSQDRRGAVSRPEDSHHNSSIDAQHLARNVAGFSRREKGHCIGDIFGGARLAQRNF